MKRGHRFVKVLALYSVRCVFVMGESSVTYLSKKNLVNKDSICMVTLTQAFLFQFCAWTIEGCDVCCKSLLRY